jgi:AcrR family transcriptional regulator
MATVRLTREEKREQTREELVAAADRMFTGNGFHATSLDQIAGEAGFTKGAVYSNFSSKEDLFFEVYERRAAASIAQIEAIFAQGDALSALNRLSTDTVARRGRDDGWLAVFFEFWAHVIRHPELRERFAQVRERVLAPFVDAVERLAVENGFELPADPAGMAIAMNIMQVGLGLERLTRPDLIDVELGARMGQTLLHGLEKEGR